MENGVLVPQESDDRRELLSTKRGGKTLHLVVKSDASGFWSNEGDAEALKQQERQERAISMELPRFGGQVSGLHGRECTGADELLLVVDWAEVANR